MKKPRKEEPINFNNLTEDQKAFIKAKVKELESIDNVRAHYSMKSTVCAYALQIAKEIYEA